eukprot:TRINITY_DN37299_c1_g1_i2.p2 TRINITY_DN37299_c1_g1~~TRINITY_DN37299_c1_g1_i2.p2  ORF type:complete len:249 (+),score=78.14 TRINITY_DN37299_c1_g1_i2:79-747(+)
MGTACNKHEEGGAAPVQPLQQAQVQRGGPPRPERRWRAAQPAPASGPPPHSHGARRGAPELHSTATDPYDKQYDEAEYAVGTPPSRFRTNSAGELLRPPSAWGRHRDASPPAQYGYQPAAPTHHYLCYDSRGPAAAGGSPALQRWQQRGASASGGHGRDHYPLTAPHFSAGQFVDAYWHGAWYTATVTCVHGNGTCDLIWSDGSTSEQMPQHYCRVRADHTA